MATRETELYDEDFYQWSREQAAAVRRLSVARWAGLLDLEHLALEVEEQGSEARDAEAWYSTTRVGPSDAS